MLSSVPARSFAGQLAGAHNRRENLLVARAAAEISCKAFANIRFRGMGVPLKKRYRSDHHAWSANSALRTATFKKRFLHRIQTIFACNSFDRPNRRAVCFDGREEATVDDLAVHQHCAGATFTFSAAFFCAGQAHFLAQDIEEPRHRIRLNAA
jgi:hypothetical protein